MDDGCKLLNCNDNNPCTNDSCANGSCVYTYNTNFCDDGDRCTKDDHCLQGRCIGGTNLNCNDNNPCTNDSCLPSTGCVNGKAVDGTVCSSTGQTCSSGTCQCSKGSVEVCNDGIDNNCDGLTDCADPTCFNKTCNAAPDACHAAGVCRGIACVNDVRVNAPCDDKDACTLDDKCGSTGVCAGTPKTCNTPPGQCFEFAGTCSNGSCRYPPKPRGTNCNDGFSCTTNDFCDGSSDATCTGTSTCNDNNICTGDVCTASGCSNVPVSDNVGCGAGSYCRSGQCKQGCLVGGVFYPAGDVDQCRVCNPANPTVLTNKAAGTSCKYGSGCVVGACNASGQCNATAVYAPAGTPCGNTPGQREQCGSNGVCSACGKRGQYCCKSDTDRCDSDADGCREDNGRCDECGSVGKPCCESSPSCSNSSTCVDGSYKGTCACGSFGQACCTAPGSTPCNTLTSTGFDQYEDYSCGSDGMCGCGEGFQFPCCHYSGSCTPGTVTPDCKPGFTYSYRGPTTGLCNQCGGAGQWCCGSSTSPGGGGLPGSCGAGLQCLWALDNPNWYRCR